MRISSGRYSISGVDIGRPSHGVWLVTSVGGAATTIGSSAPTSGWTPTGWCVAASHPGGSRKTFRYTARDGLQTGQCTDASTADNQDDHSSADDARTEDDDEHDDEHDDDEHDEHDDQHGGEAGDETGG